MSMFPCPRWRFDLSRLPRLRLSLLLLTAVLLVQPKPAGAETGDLVFPGAQWETVAPEALGYSSQKLAVLREWLKMQPTSALQVSVDGRVIFEYGDVQRATKVASMRKSVLAMLYGNYVASGKIDLDRTVGQIGLDDAGSLSPIEKNATLRQILEARSGIYHPTANTEMNAADPPRGTKAPGTYYQYQNWDFNAAGAAFEKLTGKDIFAALESDLAKPIGLQDFDRSLLRKNPQIAAGRLVSAYPEYAMYFSTRDLGRLGLLMLADGDWNGRQVMPKGWRDRITTLTTPAADIHPLMPGSLETSAGLWGYGMLWWVWQAPRWSDVVTGPYQGAYTAMGANGQYLTVLPALGMVIAHNVAFDFVRGAGKVDTTKGVTWQDYMTIVQMLISSRLSP